MLKLGSAKTQQILLKVTVYLIEIAIARWGSFIYVHEDISAIDVEDSERLKWGTEIEQVVCGVGVGNEI